MSKGVEFLYTVSNIQVLQQFLDQNKNMDISSLRDDKKNTVLHNAAFNNRFEIMKLFVDHIRKVEQGQYWKNNSVYKKPIKQAIQALINQGNAQGYTCFHYATYRGNVQMLKWLETLGGNLMCMTKTGFSLLHSAAQGDKLAPMLYLYRKQDLNNSLNSIDYKKNSVLHEAAKCGSESIVQFLLAQQSIQIDVFDSQNQTPLHVAVQNGRTKIVKRLLIKGADRSLTNGQGQTPMEMSRVLQFKKISHILNNNYSVKDFLKFYCNVKTRYQPQKRSYVKSLLFLIALLYVTVSSHLLIIPTFQIGILYGAAALDAILLVLFFTLICKSPKVYEHLDYKQLINKLPICSTCCRQKKPRSYHCQICKVCVSQYDHHCPWINRCVGKHNLIIFIIFLILLVIIMLKNAFLEVIGIFQLDFAFKQYRNFGASDQTMEVLQIQYKLFLAISLFIIALFFVPIFILLINQLSNLFKNMTTYERYSDGKSRSRISDNQNESQQSLLQKSYHGQCSFKNCKIMCGSEENELVQNYTEDDE